MSFNQNHEWFLYPEWYISRMVKLFLFFFPLTAGGDKKADAGAGAGGEFQFVSYLYSCWARTHYI